MSQDSCLKSGDNNQQWTFVRTGIDPDGSQLYAIRNTSDNLCLDVSGTSVVPAGAPVIESVCFDHDNQDFSLVPRMISGGAQYYRLVNAATGMCLDVDGIGTGGAGAALSLISCLAGDDHEWALVENPEH